MRGVTGITEERGDDGLKVSYPTKTIPTVTRRWASFRFKAENLLSMTRQPSDFSNVYFSYTCYEIDIYGGYVPRIRVSDTYRYVVQARRTRYEVCHAAVVKRSSCASPANIFLDKRTHVNSREPLLFEKYYKIYRVKKLDCKSNTPGDAY